ncbi:MAG: hypothetical protein ACK4TK_10645 [Thiobacillaceae bacterium]
MARRAIQLRKVCPRCGDGARAEGKLPGFPGPRPTVYDLDDLPRLAARHSLGTLLALVELLPYKQFHCPRCGHSFRLENAAAKEMALGMLAALRPVSDDHPRPARRTRQSARARPKPQPHLPTIAASANDREPEGLD